MGALKVSGWIFLMIMFSSASYAGSLNFDLRVDHFSQINNDAAKTAGQRDHSKWYAQTARLDLLGQAQESLSYRMRINFGKDSSAINKRDNLNDHVELAFINHKFSENSSLTMGKFDADMGGFEGLIGGNDIYLRSATLENTVSYYTGAKLDYTKDTHKVALHVANNKSDILDGTELAQNKGFLGLVYTGQFSEKTWESIVSHHTVSPGTGTDGDKVKHNYSTVGLKYNQESYSVALDYNLISMTNSTDKDKTDDTQGFSLDFVYKMEQARFMAKLASATEKNGDTGAKTNHTRSGLVYEITPEEDTKFRYHVAYNMIQKKPDSADAQNNSQIILGMHLYADVLK